MVIVVLTVLASVCLLALGLGACFFVAGKLTSSVGLALLFGTLGVGAFGVVAAHAWDAYRFTQGAVSTWGKVVDVGKSTHQDKEGTWVTDYAPRVRFVTPEEQVVEFIGPIRNWSSYQRDQNVVVVYLPGQPEGSARIQGIDWVKLLLLAGLFVVGAVFSAAAWAIVRSKPSGKEVGTLRSVSFRDRRKAAISPQRPT